MQAIDCPKPGIYSGIPFATYRAWDALSQSDLKRISKESPAHWAYKRGKPRKSAAMNLGSLVDCLLLEPHEFERLFVRAPVDASGAVLAKRSKADKQAWADVEASGKTAVKPDELALAHRIKQAVVDHEIGGQIVKARGKRQLSLVWDDPATGLRLKGRLDLMLAGSGDVIGMMGPTITDLKIVRAGAAAPNAFGKYCGEFGLDVQAAVYSDAARTLFGVDVGFWLLAAESEAPHPVMVYRVSDTVREIGRAKYRDAIRAYQACKESGEWTGYGDGIQDLVLPRWHENDGVTETYSGGFDDE